MKKILALALGIFMVAATAFGLVACDKGSGKDDGKDNNNSQSQLDAEKFDIDNFKVGGDSRLKMKVENGGYIVEYKEVCRNEYVAISADVSIDTSVTNTFTMVYENLGTEDIYVSIEFANAQGKTGYGGGTLSPGEKTETIRLDQCHQYGTGVELGTVTKIQIFFDSGWENGTNLNLYSGKVRIDSIKLSNEVEEEPQLPDENAVKLSTSVGDAWKPESTTTLKVNKEEETGAITIERTSAAPQDGDYANWVAINYSGMVAACNKIVFTFGEETSFNMLMVQVQLPGDDNTAEEIIKMLPGSVQGEKQIVVDLTSEQAQKMMSTSNQYFMIWLDADSGNGTGKAVIEKIEFYAPEGYVESPEEGEGEETLLSTTIGDLWKDDTVTTLVTDNDAKTITRITAAGAEGDYGNKVCLNYQDMEADCIKIVFTLSEDSSYDMMMIQVQDSSDAEIINFVASGEKEIVINLTKEQAEKMTQTSKQYFMIWLDANSGNGTGTVMIESVEFFAAASAE